MTYGTVHSITNVWIRSNKITLAEVCSRILYFLFFFIYLRPVKTIATQREKTGVGEASNFKRC